MKSWRFMLGGLLLSSGLLGCASYAPLDGEKRIVVNRPIADAHMATFNSLRKQGFTVNDQDAKMIKASKRSPSGDTFGRYKVERVEAWFKPLNDQQTEVTIYNGF